MTFVIVALVAAVAALVTANRRHLSRCRAAGICGTCEGDGTYLDRGGLDGRCEACGGDGTWHDNPVWHPAH